MNTLFQNSLLFLMSTSLLSGCVQAPKQSASNENIPAKPYTAPPPPKKISFIPGNAITNIVAGNTLDKLPAYNIRAGGGDYTYYSRNGRVYAGDQYTGPAVWYVLDDRFCTRTLKYNTESCFRIELDGDQLIFHDVQGYGFRRDKYRVYRGNAAKLPGVPDESQSTSSRSNAATGFMMLVGAVALIAATTWASTPISNSSNDNDYLDQARERERERERERRKTPNAPGPDTSIGCAFGDRKFGTCPN